MSKIQAILSFHWLSSFDWCTNMNSNDFEHVLYEQGNTTVPVPRIGGLIRTGYRAQNLSSQGRNLDTILDRHDQSSHVTVIICYLK